MTVNERIKSRRKQLGFSADYIAEQLGVSRATVYRYESADIENMGIDKLEPIAKALQTTPAYLMGWEEPAPALPRGLRPVGKGSRIPLYGRIACGTPILAVEDLDDTAWLPDGVKADFALTACGDSMINARIFDGDIVYIRDVEVQNGDIAAVIVRDEEVTLKRFYYYPDECRMVLRAENPTVKAQEYTKDELSHVRILGKAICFLSGVR